MKSLFLSVFFAIVLANVEAQTSFGVEIEGGQVVITQVQAQKTVTSSVQLEGQVAEIDKQITSLSEARATLVALLAKVREAEKKLAEAVKEKPKE